MNLEADKKKTFKQEFKRRCFNFSLSVIKLSELLRDKKINWLLIDQLVRSGTSIGANIVEGGNSTSRKEFINYFQIKAIKTKISAVVAMDEKRGIGKDNRLLFRIKQDFERMRKLIKGKPIIMGRNTYESMLTYTEGKIIPGSINIVVTHDQNYGNYHKEGCVVAHSLEEALKRARLDNPEEIIIFGGAKIYEQSMNIIDRLYLTVVEGDFKADSFFPDYSDFKKILFEKSGTSEGLKYKFLDLER